MLGADGHRQRVLEKFLTYGGEIFADYELLEFILMQSIPRKDVKPLAKELLMSFGSLENVLNAPTDQLKQIKGVGERTIGLFHLMMTVSQKLTKERLKKAPILSDWQSLLDYAQLTYMGENIEKFRVLYLNRHYQLIHSEVHQTGTTNHVPVYPREILKRALNVNASAVVLIHNHPSGEPLPSKDDLEVTKEIERLLSTIPIKMVDHLIIGANKKVYSFRAHHL